ncbi:fluoride efflux transporter CrcB [beta proteobacterium MWH-UniP1]
MPIKLMSVIAICIGASLGALARWQLAERLNGKLSMIPMGTLAANWVGAYLIGLAVAYFSDTPKLSEEWRLLIITGFLGGLTTFSAFSAEVVGLLQQGKWLWAGIEISAHVVGSIMFTLLGFASYALIR